MAIAQFVTLVVLLFAVLGLVYRLEQRLSARIDRLEDRMDRGFERLDNKLDLHLRQDHGIKP